MVRNFPIERKLDELNQTVDLKKKIEANREKPATIEKYGIKQEYVKDTKEDIEHLLQYKNLPSIRDRLLSIKTKQ